MELSVFLFLSCVAIGLTTAKSYIPVFIWSGNEHPALKEPAPGLKKVDKIAFSHLLHKLTSTHPQILLFAEENLSVEDFSWKDEHDQTAFPRLMTMISTLDYLYLPAVENPLREFSELSSHGYKIVQYTNDIPSVDSPTMFKVHLRDPKQWETRPILLRSHDEDIARISMEFMSKYRTGIIVYTGRHASFSESLILRQKRQVEDEPIDSVDIIMHDQNRSIYAVTTAPIEFRRNDNVSYISHVTYGTKELKDGWITLDVNFKEGDEVLSVDLIFYAPDNQAWTLTGVKVEKEIKIDLDLAMDTAISAPAGWSYFCNRDITFVGEKDGNSYSLVFHGLQAQPRVKNDEFGPAIDCIPTMSHVIWQALLVVGMLLLVLFISILMILDIKVMDRFENSKTGSINVSNAE